MDNDVIICRCQEVTRQEIVDAIRDGAGKTCERLVMKIIAEETGIPMEEILPQKKRMPVRPVKIGVIGGQTDE